MPPRTPLPAAITPERRTTATKGLRLRNPDNAPDAWERSMLERFEQELAAGAEPGALEAWSTESKDGRELGRWIKAIPTAPMCTTCHGVELEPALAETIRHLYPADQATGFRPGELRGAFTATVDLSRSQEAPPHRD